MFRDQKAQEIALALIKISVYARRPEFRHRLEKLAFEILEQAGRRDFAELSRTIAAGEGLVRFGKTIYEIEPINADILLKEFGNLNSAIRQIAEFSLPDLGELPDIGGLFTRKTLFEGVQSNEKSGKTDNPAIIQQVHHKDESGNGSAQFTTDNSAKLAINNPAKEENKIVKRRRKIAKSGKKPQEIEDNPAIRQSAIIEKIRQFGNNPAKFKDIIAGFPDFSERTLRYDLQRLCNQGVLERIGTGGPSTYYKLREI